jgi:hypothetical protein
MISEVTGGKTFRAKSESSVKTIYRELGSSSVERHSTREVSSGSSAGPLCCCWHRSQLSN